MNIKKFFKRFRKKKETLPTMYNALGFPIKPLRTNTDKKIRHALQRPTSFTKEEVDEILKQQSTKKRELELSPP